MTNNKQDAESVLLVDDNPTNLQVLFQTLDGKGYKLLVAKNGETALSISQKAQPDLILLDIMMPGIDGFEVCRRLKADESTMDIPVIFLSALDDTADKVKGLQVGAVDYVSKPFQPEEVIARVNTQLTIHRLSKEVQSQRDQLEHELEIVSEVQRDLLPAQLPKIKGLELGVYYQTSRYAGGDYYDIINISDSQWGILVADAEGHGAPAAVMMAMTCALFRASPNFSTEPDAVISYLNQNLCNVNEASFVTAIYVIYDVDKRTIRMARAGHPLPMIYSASDNRSVKFNCKGVFPLGIDAYNHVPVAETRLERGDRLLLFTDGVSERFNKEGDIYGEDRLLKQLEMDQAGEPEGILNGIMKDVERFADGEPAEDDQALLIGIVG
jgi:sigma-B regulation protein RsbU (phosphoserine phosphatase)